MDEVYKDIEGYEGLYQVSNLGNVKSLVDSNGVSREKIRKPSISSNGYLHVILYKNKTIKHFSVSACCIGERKSHKGYEWRYL